MSESNYPPPPDKLSELVRLVLKDGRALDRSLYLPVSSVWHEPVDDQTDARYPLCRVCDAGAVMAGTLGSPPEISLRLIDYPDAWRSALAAVDHLRQGDYVLAASMLLLASVRGFLSKEQIDHLDLLQESWPPAVSSFRGWEEFSDHLQSLEELAGYLEEVGL